MLKPGERRFVRIGRDPEIELQVLAGSGGEEEQRVVYAGGQLRVHCVRSGATVIRLGSRGDRPREVYVALDVVKNASVQGSDRIDYDRESRTAFAVFDIRPGESRELEVETREGVIHVTPSIRSARTSCVASPRWARSRRSNARVPGPASSSRARPRRCASSRPSSSARRPRSRPTSGACANISRR